MHYYAVEISVLFVSAISKCNNNPYCRFYSTVSNLNAQETDYVTGSLSCSHETGKGFSNKLNQFRCKRFE